MFDDRLTRKTIARTLRTTYQPTAATPPAITDALARLEARCAALALDRRLPPVPLPIAFSASPRVAP